MRKKACETEALLSVTALGKLFRLDRGTVARRLEKVTPAKLDSRGKFYRLDEAAPAIARIPDTGPSAKQEKTETEAALLKLKLQREQGEVVPTREVFDYSLRLFRALHNRIGVRFPREVAPQLYRADSADNITTVLQHELGRIFNDLREDHPQFLVEAGVDSCSIA